MTKILLDEAFLTELEEDPDLLDLVSDDGLYAVAEMLSVDLDAEVDRLQEAVNEKIASAQIRQTWYVELSSMWPNSQTERCLNPEQTTMDVSFNVHSAWNGWTVGRDAMVETLVSPEPFYTAHRNCVVVCYGHHVDIAPSTEHISRKGPDEDEPPIVYYTWLDRQQIPKVANVVKLIENIKHDGVQ